MSLRENLRYPEYYIKTFLKWGILSLAVGILGGLLGTAPIMALRPYSPAKFIHRGGRIPAPIHSLKN